MAKAKVFSALLIAAGSICFSLMGLFVKLASKHTETTTFSLLAIRSIFGLVCSGLAALSSKLYQMCTTSKDSAATVDMVGAASKASTPSTAKLSSNWFRSLMNRWFGQTTRTEWLWLVARCCGGFSAVLLEYAALRVLPLGVNTMIFYSSPAFISMWAAALFGERVPLRVLLCLTLCFGGLMLIVRPWTLREDMPRWACFLALTAAILTALAYVALRELKALGTQMVLNFFLISSLLASVISGLIMDRLPLPPLDSPAWWPLLGVGLLAYAAEVCITLGSALAGKSLGEVTVLKFLSPVCSTLWGVLFLNETPETLDIVGGVLVIAPSAAILRLVMVASTSKPDLGDVPPASAGRTEEELAAGGATGGVNQRGDMGSARV